MGYVAVIDYGMGNLHSAAKALQKVSGGKTIRICDQPADVLSAERIVFPGVGAIRDCMAELSHRGLDVAIRDSIDSGKPTLGICVGMQSLLTTSEENGNTACLDVIDGAVTRFPNTSQSHLKVPHMGWNRVQQTSHALWQGIPDQSRFYFVHSFRVANLASNAVAGYCHYGDRFVAAVARDNLFATQFHPEKSAPHGLTLLRNFLQWLP